MSICVVPVVDMRNPVVQVLGADSLHATIGTFCLQCLCL